MTAEEFFKKNWPDDGIIHENINLLATMYALYRLAFEKEQGQPVSGSLPFTDEQLLEMEGRPFPSKLWNEAFNFYNADKNNARLSMGCRPCFNKVMVYLLKIRFTNNPDWRNSLRSREEVSRGK